jgi:hypothetical protein
VKSLASNSSRPSSNGAFKSKGFGNLLRLGTCEWKNTIFALFTGAFCSGTVIDIRRTKWGSWL